MKNQLRKSSLEKRKHLDTNLLSSLIINNLFSTDEYQNFKNVICYYPLKYEVNTLRCLNDKTKNIFLPRVNGESLDICTYSPDKISSGAYGIYEPQTEKISSFNNIDIIIIPCVAADINGYRLGYGKGYYDRLLQSMPRKIIKVVLSFSDLLYETVYPDKYDEKADIVITDKEVWRI